MKAKIVEGGRITIPKALRQKLGLKPGTIPDFDAQKGTLVAVKVESQNPIDVLYGALGQGRCSDNIVDDLRNGGYGYRH